jgi:hypothetical protein
VKEGMKSDEGRRYRRKHEYSVHYIRNDQNMNIFLPSPSTSLLIYEPEKYEAHQEVITSVF